MANETRFRELVLGGGVAGLAALEHLSLNEAGPLGLIEAFELGHDRGSSHGTGRLARSTYDDPLYVRLTRRALAEGWPRLERDVGQSLLHPTPGCVFGPAEGLFEQYALAVTQADSDVERIDAAEARRRFPAFRFEDSPAVLHDHTACIVAAADTLRGLRRLACERGARVFERTRCTAIHLDGDPIRVDTDRGTFFTERLVIAAGAWTARLLPALADRLRVVPQRVAFFAHESEEGAPAFPLWIRLGAGDNGIHYGLPPFGQPGLKVGRHRTCGEGIDPDVQAPEDEEAELEDLRTTLSRELTRPLGACLSSEPCLYTMTDDEDFVLGLLDGDPRVAIAAGLSGHGFKFAPLIGRVLGELVTRGRTSVEEFESARARFAP